MANGPRIRSSDDLEDYLRRTLTERLLSPDEIVAIARSARFIDGRFKGMDAGPLIAKWTRREQKNLIAALGDPTIVANMMADADGNCTVPRDNWWCAQY